LSTVRYRLGVLQLDYAYRDEGCRCALLRFRAPFQ
jgi:hypothetical protein